MELPGDFLVGNFDVAQYGGRKMNFEIYYNYFFLLSMFIFIFSSSLNIVPVRAFY